MNILIVNHYAGSVYHGMEFRPYYLGLEWVKAGHNVTVVAADCSHLRSKKVTLTDSFETENIDGINYVWLKTLDYTGNGVRRALNMASFVAGLFRFSKRIISIAKPDVVIASSTYPADIFPSRYIANKSNAKLVFEIHDLWPLSPMELGNMSKYHPFIMTMQYAENYAYKYCDKVISILPNTLVHCVEHGLDKNKWHCIQNGYSPKPQADYSPLDSDIQEAIRNKKNEGNFLIGYAGGFQISNGLDYFIKALAKLDKTKFHCFMIGDGSEKSKIMSLADKLNCPVSFFDRISPNKINSFLKTMDVLYLGWLDKKLYRYGISPNKLLDYLYSGTMIIHAVPETNDLVAQANAGISVPCENIDELTQALNKALNMPLAERLNLGKNGQKFLISNLLYSELAKKFINLLKN